MCGEAAVENSNENIVESLISYSGKKTEITEAALVMFRG
jgi:hypothetical protein